ncbi:MAG: hypothetical protein GY801_45670 [bacterium]|nr:hypothetical protein [bacterium]
MGERTGVLLEMSMVDQLTSYITAVLYKNNPEQKPILNNKENTILVSITIRISNAF